jgi:hypothetical protein
MEAAAGGDLMICDLVIEAKGSRRKSQQKANRRL